MAANLLFALSSGQVENSTLGVTRGHPCYTITSSSPDIGNQGALALGGAKYWYDDTQTVTGTTYINNVNKIRVEVSDTLIMNSVFDNVSAVENQNQTVDYRCVWILNTSTNNETISNIGLQVSKVGDFDVDIKYGKVPNSTNNPIIANENTDPTSQFNTDFTTTWESPYSVIQLLNATNTFLSLAPMEAIPLWIRRTPITTAGVGTQNCTITFNLTGIA